MRGIALRRLTPFRYFGVKDDIDYANIPWRNRRFDPEELTRAAQTEARMATLWRAWKEHPGTRTLVFCCSIAHAVFVRSWLRDRGARVAAVFVADGSDDRDTALRDLDAGALDAVIAVDVFNEGVDVPSVDRVVMLRPTESGVVFLQQLGRGLRVSEGKEQITVIDFVGNHRIFLDRLRTLLSLGDRGTVSRVRELLASAGPMELPEGCSVELAIEAKELLQKLFRPGGTDEVERAYRDLALERGAKEDSSQRPTAGEMQRMSYRPSLLRERHGSWLEFVRGEGHLTESEARAVELAGPFLRDLESTEMTKCFKMVALQALLDEDALTSGLPLDALARRSHAILRRSPELFADLPGDVRLTTLDADGLRRFVAYWRANPIAAWTGAKKAGPRPTSGSKRIDSFRLDLRVDPDDAREITGPPHARARRLPARAGPSTASASGRLPPPTSFVCKRALEPARSHSEAPDSFARHTPTRRDRRSRGRRCLAVPVDEGVLQRREARGHRAKRAARSPPALVRP
jgi:hypothetical protein